MIPIQSSTEQEGVGISVFSSLSVCCCAGKLWCGSLVAPSGFAGTTISRGDLGGKYDYSALPVRQSGAENLRRRVIDDHWPGQALKTWWHGPPRPTKPLSILIPLKIEKLVPLQSYGAYAVRAVGRGCLA